MAPDPAPPPRAGGGMSLYANLLESNDNTTATISRAPVVFKPGDIPDASSNARATKPDPAFRFQPIRRPVPVQKKSTSKPVLSFPKPVAPVASASASASAPAPAPASATASASASEQPRGTSTLADWTTGPRSQHQSQPHHRTNPAVLDDHALRRKRKKKSAAGRGRGRGGRDVTDWDELYDPTRPTNVDEYMRSDERVAEAREWKDKVLYRHHLRRRQQQMQQQQREGGSEHDNNNDDDDYDDYENECGRRGRGRSRDEDLDTGTRRKNNAFAPPSSYGLVPPPPQEPAVEPRHPTPSPPPQPGKTTSPPPPSAPAPASTPPAEGIISRAPIRYANPAATAAAEPASASLNATNQDGQEDRGNNPYSPAAAAAAPEKAPEEAKSSRPGQAGFAQRLMSKYGWTSGSGLGADETGITNPLQVKKQKKHGKNNNGGGGGGGGKNKIPVIAKITGGHRRQPQGQGQGTTASGSGSGSGPGSVQISRIIRLSGLLSSMSDTALGAELAEGTLQQEIGEELGDKYGRVERLRVDEAERSVYVRFVDAASALKAVTELGDRVFDGNGIEAEFVREEEVAV